MKDYGLVCHSHCRYRMKSLSQHIERKLPPLKLYLDDIECIVEKLRSLSPNVQIQAGDYRLDDVVDLADIGAKVIRQLYLEINQPLITLRLVHYACILTLYNKGDVKAYGIFEEVYNYLQSKINITIRIGIAIGIVAWVLALCLLPGLTLAVWLTPFGKLDRVTRFFPALYVLLGVLTCFMFLAVILYWNFHTTLIPKKKVEAPSFWERNWNQIAVAVLIAVISFSLGWLSRFLPGPSGAPPQIKATPSPASSTSAQPK